jgi:hypothetical protein
MPESDHNIVNGRVLRASRSTHQLEVRSDGAARKIPLMALRRCSARFIATVGSGLCEVIRCSPSPLSARDPFDSSVAAAAPPRRWVTRSTAAGTSRPGHEPPSGIYDRCQHEAAAAHRICGLPTDRGRVVPALPHPPPVQHTSRQREDTRNVLE